MEKKPSLNLYPLHNKSRWSIYQAVTSADTSADWYIPTSKKKVGKY